MTNIAVRPLLLVIQGKNPENVLHGGAKTLQALPDKSVLLVEDSTLTRFSSRRVLEEKGYLVDEAASGQEALVKAREKENRTTW